MPDWEEVEEPRFLREAQDGNAEAFGELYTRYVEGIFRFLFVHLDNQLDAEDLTGRSSTEPGRLYRDTGLKGSLLQLFCTVSHGML